MPPPLLLSSGPALLLFLQGLRGRLAPGSPPSLCVALNSELWLVVVPFVEPVYTLSWPSPAVSVSPVSQLRASLSRCDILEVKTRPSLRLSLETIHFK